MLASLDIVGPNSRPMPRGNAYGLRSRMGQRGAVSPDNMPRGRGFSIAPASSVCPSCRGCFSALGAVGPVPQRSFTWVTTGPGEATITRDLSTDPITSRASAPVWFLQPNAGMISSEHRAAIIRRRIEFPRTGILPTLPLEAVAESDLAPYPEGPAIPAGTEIPRSAGFLSPLWGAAMVLGLAIGGFFFWRFRA